MPFLSPTSEVNSACTGLVLACLGQRSGAGVMLLSQFFWWGERQLFEDGHGGRRFLAGAHGGRCCQRVALDGLVHALGEGVV